MAYYEVTVPIKDSFENFLEQGTGDMYVAQLSVRTTANNVQADISTFCTLHRLNGPEELTNNPPVPADEPETVSIEVTRLSDPEAYRWVFNSIRELMRGHKMGAVVEDKGRGVEVERGAGGRGSWTKVITVPTTRLEIITRDPISGERLTFQDVSAAALAHAGIQTALLIQDARRGQPIITHAGSGHPVPNPNAPAPRHRKED